jgi:hypothetical protein
VLVNEWPGELYNAFVFAQGEKATPTGAPVVPARGLERVPPPQVSGGIKWRNAAYALQWWVFALFAAYMWWRMVRDDSETSQGASVSDQSPAHDTPVKQGKATNV